MKNDRPRRDWVGLVIAALAAVAASSSAFSGHQSSLAAQESARISGDQRDVDRPALSVETLNAFDMFASGSSPELYLDGDVPEGRPVLVANYAIRNDGNRDATITAIAVRYGSRTQLINFSSPGDAASAVANDSFPGIERQVLSPVSKLTVPAGAAEFLPMNFENIANALGDFGWCSAVREIKFELLTGTDDVEIPLTGEMVDFMSEKCI